MPFSSFVYLKSVGDMPPLWKSTPGQYLQPVKNNVNQIKAISGSQVVFI